MKGKKAWGGEGAIAGAGRGLKRGGLLHPVLAFGGLTQIQEVWRFVKHSHRHHTVKIPTT